LSSSALETGQATVSIVVRQNLLELGLLVDRPRYRVQAQEGCEP
jgi:hypothetical protein